MKVPRTRSRIITFRAPEQRRLRALFDPRETTAPTDLQRVAHKLEQLRRVAPAAARAYEQALADLALGTLDLMLAEIQGATQ